MPTLREQVERVAALAKEKTPGEWTLRDPDFACGWVCSADGVSVLHVCARDCCADRHRPENVAFVLAAANLDWDALVAALAPQQEVNVNKLTSKGAR